MLKLILAAVVFLLYCIAFLGVYYRLLVFRTHFLKPCVERKVW